MSQSKFDIEYNNWLRRVEVTEADSVWEEIQYELDFADTWESISHELDRIAPVSSGMFQGSLVKTAIITSSILLLMFVPMQKIDNPVVRQDIIAFSNNPLTGTMDASSVIKIPEDQNISQNESSLEKGIEANQADVPLKKPDAEITEKTIIEKLPDNIVATDNPVEKAGISNGLKYSEKVKPAGLLNDDNRGEKSGKDILSKSGIPEIQPEGLEELDSPKFVEQSTLVFNRINNRKLISDINLGSMLNGFSLPFNLATIADNSNRVYTALKFLDVGIIYSYKNTWLINYETRNGLNPARLGNTLPTFHKDIGLSSTLLLKDRHFIGLDFIIKSESGQNYEQYINASYLRRNIQLNYSKFQGYYIWNRGVIPGQLLTGGYLAWLNLGEERQGDEKITISDNYNKYDYGLMMGYQLSIFLQHKIIVRPGFRINYNLVNIFRGDELTPGYLKDTRNLSAGFKISLSYRFSH